MTFSIVARSDDGQSWGVAVASKFLAVGSAVPAAVAGVGALATQASANVAWKGEVLALLDEGATAPVALQRVLDDDPLLEHRQIGIVDLDGTAAAHTGAECLDWAGHRVGDGVCVQGNVLVGPQVLDAMLDAWRASEDERLEARLLGALVAGDAAGGDRRGRQSAALFVVRDGAGYDGLDDVAVDLRVDDAAEPCRELGRLLELHRRFLSPPAEEDKVALTPELREEAERLARAAGQPSLAAWLGSENYELRSDLAAGWIDGAVLAELRG